MEACHAILNYNTNCSTCCSSYTLAKRHFQVAFSKPNEVAFQALKDRQIILENSHLESLLGRVVHIVIALFECIPLIGIIIAVVDKYFFHTPSLSQEVTPTATAIQTLDRTLDRGMEEERHIYFRRLDSIRIQTQADLIGIAERHPNITRLHISNPDITNADLQHLRGLTRLEKLTLQGSTRITDDGLAHLQGIPIKELDLNGCIGITGDGFAHLQGMPIKKLYLEECTGITDNGLAHLQGMPIKELDLEGCSRITDDGLAHLQGMPIKELDLNGCTEITDDGLAHLQGMPLRGLYLGGCTRITDNGLAHLQRMALTMLNIAGCTRITDNGLPHLQGMPLTSLNLERCTGITDNGRAFLRERIPGGITLIF